MGKTKRAGKRNHTVAIHGTSAYPYSPKVVTPRTKPLQRTPYSASDLRRLFASVNSSSKNGRSSSGSLAHRAASSVERLIARIMRSPQQPRNLRRSFSGAGAHAAFEPRSLTNGATPVSSLESWQLSPVQVNDTQLKRLGFILSYADYYFNLGFGLAATVYSTGRAFVPRPLDGMAGSLENSITNISMPVISAVQGQSGRVLNALDAKVDGVINAASGLYSSNANALNSALQSGERSLEACTAAKDAYLLRIEDALQLLRTRGLTGAAGLAADKVVATVGSVKDIPPYLEAEVKALMLKVGESWGKLAALPPVNMLVATAQPSIDYAWTKYLDAHEAIVTAPSYNKAVDMGAEQLSKVADSAVVKTLYPAISPYADPALDAITQSDTYTALVDHLRPQQQQPAVCVAS